MPALAATRHEGASSFAPVSRRTEAVLLGLVVTLAALLRIHDLGRPSFWADEFLSLRASGAWPRSEPVFPADVVLASTPAPTRLEDARPARQIWTALRDC